VHASAVKWEMESPLIFSTELAGEAGHPEFQPAPAIHFLVIFGKIIALPAMGMGGEIL
jgi:hypothetical protein